MDESLAMDEMHRIKDLPEEFPNQYLVFLKLTTVDCFTQSSSIAEFHLYVQVVNVLTGQGLQRMLEES
jgi:hypothetical protein